jgi:hypothetical protein
MMAIWMDRKPAGGDQDSEESSGAERRGVSSRDGGGDWRSISRIGLSACEEGVGEAEADLAIGGGESAVEAMVNETT